ncbi:MAG: peptidase S41, partial [Bacteroidaceae bacterium]|nr:peptidase S41 [Bacteroidaceae bacterium]
QPITLKPSQSLRWQKPVVVLTNRSTYSAANAFVMYMRQLPNVTLVGDRTGGGSGMPFSSELPNGWSLRFSASPMFTPAMQHTEFGIDPDLKVDITAADWQRGVDTILETAIDHLKLKP